ncbi:Spherulation-specific family 4-domain-containing protein [Bisporella sp. PMI_857]|nr:Spherulation-specific family 4-domain-containing protein [Bisporella sp. PMI_857]
MNTITEGMITQRKLQPHGVRNYRKLPRSHFSDPPTEVEILVNSESNPWLKDYKSYSSIMDNPLQPSKSYEQSSPQNQLQSLIHQEDTQNQVKMVNLASVLLPLYIYPSLNTTWSSIYTSITSNPSLSFDIIINPNSGPGSAAYPDSSYVTGIAQLNSYDNAKLIGYVPTNWAARDIEDVKADIDTYAGWGTYAGSDIHVDGIFFDEAVSQYNESNYEYMSTVTAYARSLNLPTIVFNPGAVSAPEYYALADTIVAFENSASAWTEQVRGWTGDQYWGNSAVMMYGFTGDEAAQKALVDTLKATDVGSLFISSQPFNTAYSEVSGLWEDFCEALAA